MTEKLFTMTLRIKSTNQPLQAKNQKSYDFEMWHAVLEIESPALQMLYKWWPWIDLDLF